MYAYLDFNFLGQQLARRLLALAQRLDVVRPLPHRLGHIVVVNALQLQVPRLGLFHDLEAVQEIVWQLLHKRIVVQVQLVQAVQVPQQLDLHRPRG